MPMTTTPMSREEQDSNRVADLLLKQVEDTISAYFLNTEDGRLYAAVNKESGTELILLPSADFDRYIRFVFYTQMGRTLQAATLKSVADTLEMVGVEVAESKTLYVRIGRTEDSVIYDLQDGNAVVVTKSGVTIENIDDIGIHFRRLKSQRAQKMPDLKGKSAQLVSLLRPFFRLSDDELLLLTVYLVSCFFQDIAHPILLLHGLPGSTKSTFLRTISKIIDPSVNDVLKFPTKERDLVATLSAGYFFPFDNMEKLNKSQSNILCLSVTGGTIPQRKLYTNAEQNSINIKRCVALDGVSVVASAPDLLERCILLELSPPKQGERKTEKQYWDLFNEELPKILGAIFDTIKKVLNDDTEVQTECRMADFACNGYKIGEGLGTGLGDKFLEIYSGNQVQAQEETKPPMALACIGEFMEYKSDWSGTMSQLLTATRSIATKLDYRNEFPCSANALSRHIHKYKDRFGDYGLRWTQQTSGKRLITIRKK